MEIKAVDLTEVEKSFSTYLKNYMPIVHKMSAPEIVDIFENAYSLVKLEKELLENKDLDSLFKAIREKQAKFAYPPNPEIAKAYLSWLKLPEDKKEEQKVKLLAEIQKEIKSDIGMDISQKYLSKVLLNIENIKEDKAKLMKYFTNIVLKGAGHGIVSELEAMDKLANCTRNDEMLLKVIVAEHLSEFSKY